MRHDYSFLERERDHPLLARRSDHHHPTNCCNVALLLVGWNLARTRFGGGCLGREQRLLALGWSGLLEGHFDHLVSHGRGATICEQV